MRNGYKDIATVTVVVVGDDEFYRAGIAASVRDAPDLAVTGSVADAKEAVSMICRERPQIVVLDGKTSSDSNLSVVERVALEVLVPRPLMVVMSDAVDAMSVECALRFGVRALLPKPVCPDRLLAAIRAVAVGDVVLSQEVIDAVSATYVNRPTAARRRIPDLAVLTEREVEVLQLVACGLSNPEIAATLQVGEATVKTHLSRAMAKLDVGARAQMVTLAYEVGLVVPGGSDGATPAVYSVAPS